MSDPFLAASWSIGARLCRDALWWQDRCNWLGDSMEYVGGTWQVAHRSFGPDLYAGTSGIALFLARLHQQTGETLFRTTALGAARHAVSRLDGEPGSLQPGFYSGTTGIAYALTEVGDRLEAPDLTERTRKVLSGLVEQPVEQGGLDVISGSAGIIPALLLMAQRYPDLRLLELAERHGRYLIGKACRDAAGWSWDTLNVPGQRNLTGFSHGTAGIAWALLELHHATQNNAYAEAAQGAFAYERSCFDSAQRNWPDFRIFEGAPATSGTNCSVAWCHGAPGIGLSRLRAFRLTGDAMFRQEGEAALESTQAFLQRGLSGGAIDFSLCHGLSGDAELLIAASEMLGQPQYMAVAADIGRQGIERYAGQAWPCGVPGGGEAPNLMLGLAGIGHFFLRLHDSAANPSVLMVGPS